MIIYHYLSNNLIFIRLFYLDFSQGLPVVVTLTPQNKIVNEKLVMLDDVTVVDSIRQLKAAGADVVGLNCGRGPDTMIPVLEEITEVCNVS